MVSRPFCPRPGGERYPGDRLWPGDVHVGSRVGPADAAGELQEDGRAGRGAAHDACPQGRAGPERQAAGARSPSALPTAASLASASAATSGSCNPDPAKHQGGASKKPKQFVRLSHDIGGSGVKVKPNDFHPQRAARKDHRANRQGPQRAGRIRRRLRPANSPGSSRPVRRAADDQGDHGRGHQRQRLHLLEQQQDRPGGRRPGEEFRPGPQPLRRDAATSGSSTRPTIPGRSSSTCSSKRKWEGWMLCEAAAKSPTKSPPSPSSARCSTRC